MERFYLIRLNLGNLIGSHHGVAFDWDEDGFKEATNWVDGDDAILVVDLDADGSIGQGDGQNDNMGRMKLAA